jgi:hypothetical protein
LRFLFEVFTEPGIGKATGRKLPANVRCTGVVHTPAQGDNPEKEKPLVLVSLSTFFSRVRTRLSRLSSTRSEGCRSEGSSRPAP